MGTILAIAALGALLWGMSQAKASQGQQQTTQLPIAPGTPNQPTTLVGTPTVRVVAAHSGNTYQVTTWPAQPDGLGLYNFALLKSVPNAWVAWRVKLGDPNGVLVSMHVPDGHGDELAQQMMVDFLIHPTTVKKVEVA